jgi:thioredoxin-like negative regulator of GroEL
MAPIIKLPHKIYEMKTRLDGRTTIVLFWAPAITGCQEAMSQLRGLADKYDSVEFGYVDIFDDADTPSHLGLLAFPSVLVFEKGQVVKKISGPQNTEELHKKLQPWLV